MYDPTGIKKTGKKVVVHLSHKPVNLICVQSSVSDEERNHRSYLQTVNRDCENEPHCCPLLSDRRLTHGF
jgi:hypothetical protein